MVPTLLILLQAIGGSTPATPQDPPVLKIQLTLRDAITSALKNNLDLEIARYSPLKSEQDIESAWGAFDWFIRSRPTYTETLQPTASTLQASESKALNLDMGLHQITPLGISYDLTVNANRNSTNNSFATLNPSWNSSLGATVTVPTLRGFGLDARYSTIVIARNNRGVTERDFETTLMDTIVSVENAYWNLAFTRDDLKVKQSSLEVAQTLLNNNREKFDAGLVARIEVTRSVADLASREEAIIVADNAFNNAMDVLKELIDPSILRDTERETVIVPTDTPGEPETPIDDRAILLKGIGDAVRKRPELKSLRLQLQNQDLTVESAEDSTLPQVDLFASARYLGLGRHMDNKHLDETFSEDTHRWSVGMVLELPLGNWSAEATLLNAELERRRLHLQLRRLENQILVELRQAVRTIKSAEKRIEAGKKSVTAARENYEGEEARRDAGDATSFEVLDALEDYTDAQTTELKARIDYATANLAFQRAAGTLLDHYRIVLRDQLNLRNAW